MRRLLRPTLYLTIAFCSVGVYASVSTHLRSGKSLSWPAGKGVIIESDIVEYPYVGDVHTGGVAEYGVFVKYRYTVNGREHVNTRLSYPEPPHFPDRGSAEDYRRPYPTGRGVMVYYNPEKPGESCLERGSGGSTVSLFGTIVMLLSIVALCVYGLKIIPANEENLD